MESDIGTKNGHLAVVKYLITTQGGADINAAYLRSNQALKCASQYGI